MSAAKKKKRAKPGRAIVLSPDLPPDEPRSLLAVIANAARDPAVDPEKMKAFLDMQERIFNRNAEIAFNEAMLAVQGEMPRVRKTARNEHLGSKYATLTALNNAIIPVYTRHGFSLSFSTTDSPLKEHIRVICVCAHRAGFSRTYQHDVALDLAGAQGTRNKTPTQAGGSSIAYGRRYITMMIFNLTMEGEDNDGAASGPLVARVSAEQAANLQAKLEEIGETPEERKEIIKQFLNYRNINSFDELAAQAYNDSLRAIEIRKRAYEQQKEKLRKK